MIAIRGLCKRFGPVQALKNVAATFEAGEVHAVLGENGAGKSTLVNLLAGFLMPDVGSLELDGAPLPLGDPVAIRNMGVAMVHQHFMLVPEFTVAENLALARMGRRFERLEPLERAGASLAMAERLGWTLDPRARTGDLPVGVQQRIEILKALGDDRRVLILDEPTAVLGPDEVEELFRVLRDLRDKGMAILLIAHKLSEVMAVADRATVLRRGEVVATAPIAEVDEATLAAWMVGDVPPRAERTSRETPASFQGLRLSDLQVSGDRGEAAITDLSLDVPQGAIVGIGGVDGNGQVELAEAIVGVRGFSGELVWVPHGEPAVAYIPQSRQKDGLALKMSVLDNLAIAGHQREDMRRGPFLRSRALAHWGGELVGQYAIKVGALEDPVGSLSGGNQQKVVVARELDREPDLVVAVNPTRGLDVRAARFVHEQLAQARDRGAAVLLISTDLDELAAMADETYFLLRGRLRSGEGAEALVGGKA
ncbi:MAG: ABC transporter ATP-binding protein [Fimbriimonadaceae bacterium]|nr:ABC transporter ATP-binding protein [Fimbriimonadaceae bacterium]